MLNKLALSVPVLAVLWCAAAHALDPTKALTQYSHRLWRTEEGLPQNSVFSILQTQDGYLWLGTQEGLVRFDGVRFAVFNKNNTEQIKHNDIWKLLAGRQGELWIGTRGGGLSQFKDGKFTVYSKADGLADDSVQALHEDRDGALWIGTRGGGLNRFKDGKFTSYSKAEGLANATVFSTYEDREGNLWIGTDGGGLHRFKDGKFIIYSKAQGLSNDTVFAIYEDREGSLWIGTAAGLNRFKDGKFAVFGKRDGLSNENIRTIYQDRDGNLWIGTDGGGLHRFRDGKFTAFTTKEGLSNDSVGAIFEDREGSLWVGTDAGGLNRFKDAKFTPYSTKEGLSDDNARSIYEDREGHLWVGTFGGLNRLGAGGMVSYGKKDGLSSDVVLSIVEDREGSLWLGTLGGGLNRFKDGKFTVYSKQDGLSNDTVLSLHEDREGSLWIGTRSGGLNRLRDGKFSAYGAAEGLSSNDVRCIFEDRSGGLWIGTLGGGLHLFKDGKFTAYTEKDGLSKNLVLAIHEDDEGALWIGTFGGGLNRFKNGKFSSFTAKDGLFDDVVFRILEDGKGNLWISCNRGIYRVSRKELNDFADRRSSSFSSVSYGSADGMRSNECNGAHQPAGWKTRDGKLWFPTIKGVVTIDPERIEINRQPPPVIMEQVLVDNRAMELSGKAVELSPGRKKFEFHYTGLSYLSPEKVQFKYKLEGFDTGWVDAGANRTAYYTNIPPGDYTFRVIASNNDGVWNETGASFAFGLQPYFYQTKTSYVLYLLCAAGLVVLGVRFHRVRVQGLEAREQHLLKLISERQRAEAALRKEAEELARSNAQLERFAYVASHDLQEPLRAVTSYTQLLANRYRGKLDAEADEFIAFTVQGALRMQGLIKGLLAYALAGKEEGEFSPVASEAVLSSALATLQTAIEENGAEVTHDPLPRLVADGPALEQVFHNLIGNAIKFRGTDPPRIHVAATKREKEWLFSVRDNGIGIEPQYAERVFEIFQRLHGESQYGGGSGIGLSICNKIVQRHGGRIWVERAPGSGAVFYFTIAER